MKKVYLCGPIRGLSYDEAIGWRNKTREKLGPLGFECLSPMRNKQLISSEEKITDSYDNLSGGYSSHEIFARDRFDVSQSDIILANFLNRKVTIIGSLFEIAWGYLLGKYIVVVVQKDSIYHHPFIREAASAMFEDLDEAVDYIAATFGNNSK